MLEGLAVGGLSGVATYLGGREERSAAKDMASDQNAFTERMSNTSYQRAVADLKAAGLNPMLAYTQGGASAPQGAGYATENLLEGAVSSALESSRLKREIEETESRIDLNEEAKETQQTTQALQNAQADLSRASADQIRTTNVPEKIKGEGLLKLRKALPAWWERTKSWFRSAAKTEPSIRERGYDQNGHFRP